MRTTSAAASRREADDLDDLRRRVTTELAAGPILDRSALAIDGSDLMRELGVAEGPDLGRILGWLFERVVENPALNERGRLVGLARDWLVRHTPGEDRHAEARPTEVAAPATVRPSRSATPPFADPHAGPVNALPAVADLAGPSVQLYTVRAALAEDVDATLGRLAGIGFRRVEPFDSSPTATASRAASPATACRRRPPT